jgi:hypothetical protein
LRPALNVCALILLPLVAACSTWHRLPGADLSRAGNERLGHAKVFLRDGTGLDLDDAMITSDSVMGFGGDTRTRFAVARRDITRVETRQPNGPATFLVGGLAPYALGALFLAALLAFDRRALD